MAPSVTRYHGQLSSCTISEKTNDPILRKLNDGRTDGRTDGQTDESDFIVPCPTNVKCSIVKFRKGYDTSHKVQRDKKLVFI